MSAIKELMMSKEDDEEQHDALEVQLRTALREIVILNETKEQLTQVCFVDYY